MNTICLARILALWLAAVAALPCAAAEPVRDDLVAAWETHVRSLPSTVRIEPRDGDTWFLEDTDLPYSGEVRLTGAIVRPAETVPQSADFTHMGLVEVELTGLAPERRASQSYYYWLADRQSLYYSVAREAWVGAAAYQRALTEAYEPGYRLGPLSFMLNYGIWIVLLGLIGFVVWLIVRQSAKARSLMDDSADINRRARENIERSAELQAELGDIARQSRDLQAENNALLRELVSLLKNRSQ